MVRATVEGTGTNPNLFPPILHMLLIILPRLGLQYIYEARPPPRIVTAFGSDAPNPCGINDPISLGEGDVRGWNSTLGTFLNVTKTLVSRTIAYATCVMPFPLCYGTCCFQSPFPDYYEYTR
jgi:hypothetical protein